MSSSNRSAGRAALRLLVTSPSSPTNSSIVWMSLRIVPGFPGSIRCSDSRRRCSSVSSTQRFQIRESTLSRVSMQSFDSFRPVTIQQPSPPAEYAPDVLGPFVTGILPIQAWVGKRLEFLELPSPKKWSRKPPITVARHLPDYRYDRKACRLKTWLLNQALGCPPFPALNRVHYKRCGYTGQPGSMVHRKTRC